MLKGEVVSNHWRLIISEDNNAGVNMAVDEAIFRARIKNLVPNTLRFYTWRPSAVSIGKFQKMENEVHLDNCRQLGVDVVRRITGGGAVYHDSKGEITYCLVANKAELKVKSIMETYQRVYYGLVETLRLMDITVDFNEGDMSMCPNLTINHKKVSGSAQAHKKGVIIQHGT